MGESARAPAGATETAEPGTLEGASALTLNGDGSVLLSTSSIPGSLHVFAVPPAPRQVLLTQRDIPIGLAGARALSPIPSNPDRLFLAAYNDNRVSLFAVSIGNTVFKDGFE